MLLLVQVQSFLAALKALSRKEVHYGCYATTEQVRPSFFFVGPKNLGGAAAGGGLTPSIGGADRWWRPAICAPFARRRCTRPSCSGVNIFSAKTASRNGRAPLRPLRLRPAVTSPLLLPSCGCSYSLAGSSGSGRARCAGPRWSRRTSARSAMARPACSSSCSEASSERSLSIPPR